MWYKISTLKNGPVKRFLWNRPFYWYLKNWILAKHHRIGLPVSIQSTKNVLALLYGTIQRCGSEMSVITQQTPGCDTLSGIVTTLGITEWRLHPDPLNHSWPKRSRKEINSLFCTTAVSESLTVWWQLCYGALKYLDSLTSSAPHSWMCLSLPGTGFILCYAAEGNVNKWLPVNEISCLN